MWFGRVLPEDAPDPRIERSRLLRDMPAPVMGLIVQPSLEDTDSIGISSARGSAGYVSFSVSITYTLWRNPADRSDPVNLAILDDEKRAAIEAVTPWPRPRWLLKRLQRMRYPQLWEAVRTTWTRDLSELTTPAQQLADHLDDTLSNQYRDEPAPPGFLPARPAEKAGDPAATVLVDGVRIPAVEITTDRFVYAIGAQTAPHTVVTTVLPRSELPYIHIAFATRPPPST